jgi:hypothetical protein
LDQLTSKQISEWEAYDRIDPIGSWRDDFRIAKLESLLVNIVQQLYTDTKKGKKPEVTSPLDFMVDWDGSKDKEPKKQSVEEMKQILLSIASAQNKKVKRVEVQSKPPVKRTNRKP